MGLFFTGGQSIVIKSGMLHFLSGAKAVGHLATIRYLFGFSDKFSAENDGTVCIFELYGKFFKSTVIH